jgi:hypothetical protein
MPTPLAGIRACVFALLLALPAAAAAQSPRTAAALARQGPVVVDGQLDEPAWQQAPRHGDFIERKPALNTAPPDATQFALLADTQALYVAVWCHDGEPAKIRARTTTRDSFALFADDAVSVKLDPLRDRRTTHGFALNPAGARLDYRGVDESEFRTEVDAVWDGAALLTGDGWTAEFRIPWTALGLDGAALPAELGLNLSRDHSRRNATYDWALLPPPFTPVAASLYGTLRGLDRLDLAAVPPAAASTRTDDDLQVVPYALVRVDQRPGSAIRRDWNAGLDAALALGSHWRAALTVNTDFAQVDLDDRVVNLSRFGLFLPEKRDFFARDLDLFAFGATGLAQPFHSRTIGLDKDGKAVPILAGAKVVGRVSDRLRVGLLDVVTGSVGHVNHAVGRAQWELGGGANLGLLATSRLGDGTANTVIGVDTALRSAGNPLRGSAFALVSATQQKGDPNAATAPAAGVSLEWKGALVRPKLRWLHVHEKFRAGLGYVQRTDFHDLQLSTVVEPRIGKKDLEKLNCETIVEGMWAARAGNILDRGAGGGCDLTWDSGWIAGAGGQWARETVVQPFQAGGVAPVATGDYASHKAGLSLSSPGVDDLSASVSAGWSAYYGGSDLSAGLTVTLRTKARLRWETTGGFHRITFPDARTGFDSAVLTSRLAVGLSPDLNVDVYGGWNHLQRDVLGQLRLRWTVRRGSDLFLVAQQNVDASDGSSRLRSVIAKLAWSL